jgi:sarcosine oxidase subunit alpha
VESDLLRATDFLFPEGLDHHHLMVGSRLLGRVALEVARRLSGLGELPDAVKPPMRGELRTEKLVIIGAGPSGLAAQRASQGLLIERESKPGGASVYGFAPPQAAPSGEVLVGAECVGLYANDTPVPGNALLAVRLRDRLLAIVAEKVIVATGGASQPLPFAGVDRPGVHAARGLLRLAYEHGVRVGKTLALVGEGAELQRCAEALAKQGYEIARALDKPDPAALRALGNPVKALQVGDERVRCDAVAIALPPAPLHDLATCAGATAKWSDEHGGFPVQVDADGRTSVPWLFAAGTCAGGAASGDAAGRACK